MIIPDDHRKEMCYKCGHWFYPCDMWCESLGMFKCDRCNGEKQ